MTTTIGVMKQLSDQPGTVRAAVLLSSDKALADPLTELASTASITQIYKSLGLTKEYFISNVFLVQIAKSDVGVHGYSFSLKFAKPGVKLDVAQGPQGEKGDSGGSGPRGPEGPEGPEGPSNPPSGSASGDLGGTYPSPDVVALQGVSVDTAAPADGQLLTYVDANGKWEPKDPPEGVTFVAVRDALGAATTAVDFNTQRLTGVASPSAGTDAANMDYVDTIAQGLDPKDAVVAVSTSVIASLSGLAEVVDDIDLDTDGMRVLLVAQGGTAPAVHIDNGIWAVHSGAWTRPADFAVGMNVAAAYTFVQEGTAYAHSGWVCQNDYPTDVVGADALGWSQFSQSGTSKAPTFVDLDMVSGRILADTAVFQVLGSTADFNPANLGTGTVTTKLSAFVGVPSGSTAYVELYDVTNHASRWSGGPYTSDVNIDQLITTLAVGTQRLEFWVKTTIRTGGDAYCLRAALHVAFS